VATVLVLVAHPDDETFGCGSVIARAVERGHTVYVCTATYGELGEVAAGVSLEGRTLGEVRKEEFESAMSILGGTVIPSLGFVDSGFDGDIAPDSLCGTPYEDVEEQMLYVLHEVKPDVVVSITGADGHRDHKRIGDAVHSALLLPESPHASYYQWTVPISLMQSWIDQMREMNPAMAQIGTAIGTPDEAITTRIDSSAVLEKRRAAIKAHRSQVSPYEGLPDELTDMFLSQDNLVRLLPVYATPDVDDWINDRP